MKSRLTNNLWIKLISLLVAVLIWLVVTNISNPEVIRTKTVTLEVLNTEVMSSAGKTYTLDTTTAVTISYGVRTIDENRIAASDFRAYIDLEELYDVTGAVPIHVEVVNNSSLITTTPIARPSVINVVTEDLQRKEFSLTTHATGEPAEGYSVGTISLDTASVYVTGPVSLIGQISSVGVEVDVTDTSANFSGTSTIRYYDANGNTITLDATRVSADVTEVGYSVTIFNGKSLAIEFDVGGVPADGYIFTGATSDTKSISVRGLPEDLESIDTITIPSTELDVSGATTNIIVVVDISQYLPENISVVGSSEVTVTLTVEAVNRRVFTLTLSDITEVGHTAGYQYTLSPEVITIVVTGAREALLSMSEDELSATIDFTHLLAGTYSGTLTFVLPDGFSVDSYTPFEIIVEEAASSSTPSESEN